MTSKNEGLYNGRIIEGRNVFGHPVCSFILKLILSGKTCALVHVRFHRIHALEWELLKGFYLLRLHFWVVWNFQEEYIFSTVQDCVFFQKKNQNAFSFNFYTFTKKSDVWKCRFQIIANRGVAERASNTIFSILLITSVSAKLQVDI